MRGENLSATWRLGLDKRPDWLWQPHRAWRSGPDTFMPNSKFGLEKFASNHMCIYIIICVTNIIFSLIIQSIHIKNIIICVINIIIFIITRSIDIRNIIICVVIIFEILNIIIYVINIIIFIIINSMNIKKIIICVIIIIIINTIYKIINKFLKKYY
jgi:hypothetical protein